MSSTNTRDAAGAAQRFSGWHVHNSSAPGVRQFGTPGQWAYNPAW